MESRESLSKCHHVIDRFSEDIDIAFSDDLGTMLSQIIENRVYESDYEDITSYFQKTKIEYNEAIKALQKVIDSKMF